MYLFRYNFLKLFITLIPFFGIAVLFALSFFCHPTAEDLAIYHNNNVKGLLANVNDFYKNDSGRFFSFPLLFLIFNNNFFIENYFLVPVILISGLLFSGYYFVTVFDKSISRSSHRFGLKLWFTAVLLLAVVSTLFEPATFIYWVSGSITYLPSFIFFLLLITEFMQIYLNGSPKKWRFILCIFYSLSISGSNEVALYFLLCTLTGLLWIYIKIKRGISFFLLSLIGLLVLVFIFIILPGGSGKRIHHFKQLYPLSDAFILSILYTFRTFLAVLTEPVSWIIFIISLIEGTKMNGNYKRVIHNSGISALNLIVVMCILVFAFYFLIYFFSKELLPPRANNLLAVFVLIFMMITAFLLGSQTGKPILLLSAIPPYITRTMILLVFLGNQFISNAVQHLATGYVFDKVMQKRKNLVRQALESNKKYVELFSYNSDFDTVLRTTLFRKMAKLNLARKNIYPRMIYYMDPLNDTTFYINYYAGYLGVDSILYNGKYYRRAGISLK